MISRVASARDGTDPPPRRDPDPEAPTVTAKPSAPLLLLLALAVAPLALDARAVAGDAPAPTWSPAGAARVLDDRAATWFEFPTARRGEGADQTTCLSCHTLLPYAMALPALRPISADGRAGANAGKILDAVARRVENWDELDTPRFALMYDFDEPKKQQSRGTEAVLNALVLARDDLAHGRKAPSDPTRKAFDHLWSAQAVDGPAKGSWEWLNFGLEPWEATDARYLGATLAALAIGSAPEPLRDPADPKLAPRLAALRAYLRDNRAKQPLHNRAWLLLASQRLDSLLTPAERAEIAADLLAKSGDDGGWSLASLGTYARKDGTKLVKTPDGYATALAVLALGGPGVVADPARVEKGRGWLRTHQTPTGGWPAHSLNKERDPNSHVGKFMSDAATALALLALTPGR